MTRQPASDAGMSLIEILLAVSIMAVVSTMVVLTIAPARAPVEDEAERLAVRLHQAGQEAIISGQPVGLVIRSGGSGYDFLRYVDGRWWPMSDHPTLRRHSFGTSLRLTSLDGALPAIGERDDREVPAFWFDPAGLTEPFRLRLDGGEHTMQIALAPADGIDVRRLD